MMRSLEVSVEAPASVAMAWDRLALRVDAAPYHWSGWYAAWWRAFGRGRPRVVVVRRDGEVVGVVPIELDRGTVRAPTNAHTPALLPLAVDRDVLAGLARGIADLRPRTLTMDQLALAPDDETVWLATLGTTLPRQRAVTTHRSPYLDLDASWDELVTRLGKGSWKDLRRRRRRADERGRLDVRTVTATTHLDAELDRCLAVEASGWKGRQGSAIVCDPATETFYREVAAWAARRGWLRLDLLELDGRLLAFELTLRLRDAVHTLKCGFDDASRDLSPGRLLCVATTRAAAIDPCLHRAEWLGAEDDYKSDWTDGVHDRRSLRAYPPDASGAVRATVAGSRRQVRGWVRAHLGDDALDRLRVARGHLQRPMGTRGGS